MVFVPLYEVGLLEIRMEFELVNSRLDGGLMKKLFQLMRREIGDANVANFAGFEEPLHGEPCLRNIVSTACETFEALESHVDVVNVVFSA